MSESITITFTLAKDQIKKLESYSEDHINGLAQHAFLQWYEKEHEQIFTMSDLDKKINDGLEPTVNKLFGVSKSVEKGKVFENVIEETIATHFTDCIYENTSLTNHVGDGLLTLVTGCQCIIEAKSYTNTVPRSQIDKLKYDMQVTGIQKAIMFSTSPIQGKQFFDIESIFIFNKSAVMILITVLDALVKLIFFN